MAKTSADSVLMQQYNAIKQMYPDAVLLFRVGDFYKMYGEDAIIAEDVLDINPISRKHRPASSSGFLRFPCHLLDTYLHRLVKAGYRVAVCDQLEGPV